MSSIGSIGNRNQDDPYSSSTNSISTVGTALNAPNLPQGSNPTNSQAVRTRPTDLYYLLDAARQASNLPVGSQSTNHQYFDAVSCHHPHDSRGAPNGRLAQFSNRQHVTLFHPQFSAGSGCAKTTASTSYYAQQAFDLPLGLHHASSSLEATPSFCSTPCQSNPQSLVSAAPNVARSNQHSKSINKRKSSQALEQGMNSDLKKPKRISFNVAFLNTAKKLTEENSKNRPPGKSKLRTDLRSQGWIVSQTEFDDLYRRLPDKFRYQKPATVNLEQFQAAAKKLRESNPNNHPPTKTKLVKHIRSMGFSAPAYHIDALYKQLPSQFMAEW